MHEASKTVKLEQIIRLLLANYTLKEVAAYTQLSYSTVRAWCKDPQFLDSLRELSAQVYKSVTDELQRVSETLTERIESESEKALQTLAKLMDDSCVPAAVRVKAADSILDRNPAVSRTKKVDAVTSHKFLDPLYLVGVAKTAQEVDEAEQRRKELSDGTGG